MVRACLLPTFGTQSIVSHHIRSVEADDSVKNVSLMDGGRLVYNPKYVTSKVRTPAHLFCLLAHEFLHGVLGHLLMAKELSMHIAADSIINSMLTLAFPTESNRGILFREHYDKAKGIEVILRPDSSAVIKGRFRHIYRYLYNCEPPNDPYPDIKKNKISYSRPKSSADVASAVRMLWQSKGPTRGLIGSHDTRTAVPKDVVEDLLPELEAGLSNIGSHGAGGDLMRMFNELIETAKSLDTRLMEKFSDRNELYKFFELEKAKFARSSPFPGSTLTRRDSVLLSSGIYPGYFQVPPMVLVEKENTVPKVTVFLDVSGSVMTHLSEILSILRNTKKFIQSIYVFSTKCVLAHWDQLEAGQVVTTGGTDFDCVAKTILEARVKKAVVITDGYANMSEELQLDLTDRCVKVLTILFGGMITESVWAKWGPSVHLENITIG